jgi:hypothetical protein
MTRTTLSNTAERLLQLPAHIESFQYQILDKMAASNLIAASASSIESKIKLEISSEVDANGKKVYSNAETRGAEFEERSQFNSELSSIREEYEAIQRELQVLKIQVETLSNEQRNIRSILWFFAGHDDQL